MASAVGEETSGKNSQVGSNKSLRLIIVSYYMTTRIPSCAVQAQPFPERWRDDANAHCCHENISSFDVEHFFATGIRKSQQADNSENTIRNKSRTPSKVAHIQASPKTKPFQCTSFQRKTQSR